MSQKIKLLLTVLLCVVSLGIFVITVVIASAISTEKFPVNLPGKYLYTNYWNDWVRASGTWTIENGKSGAPFQTTEISCNRRSKSCEFVTAEIMLKTLRVSKETYEVVKWDAVELVATNEFPQCFRYVYSINRLTEQISGVRIKKPLTADNAQVCERFSGETLQLRLIDGSKWYWEERDKAAPGWLVLIAPATLLLLFGSYFIWRRPKNGRSS